MLRMAFSRVSTDIGIPGKKLGRLIEPGNDGYVHPVEMDGVDGLVKVVPVDLGSRHLIFDDIAVFGAAACKGAGADHQGAGIIEDTLVPAETMPDEFIQR